MMILPLFPLNSVLFPGMPIRLHIFEERYKVMMNECIDNQTPFGIVLIESGREALGPLAAPHQFGTTAHITQVQKLPFGRLNIMAVGRDRFRIRSLNRDSNPYLTGEVDISPFADSSTPAVAIGESQLRPLVSRYLTALEKSGEVQFDSADLPQDSLSLAYLAAVLLQTENASKQALLESTTTQILLNSLIRLYRKEVVLMDVLMSPPDITSDDALPFSNN